ncbi:MAG: hypothetical protein U0531_11890 [Dehalococcoidia bacterium]
MARLLGIRRIAVGRTGRPGGGAGVDDQPAVHHPPQGSLSGHYATYPFALTFITAVLGAARLGQAGWLWRRRPFAGVRRPSRTVALATALLAAQAAS